MKVIITGGLGHIGSALIRHGYLVEACDHIAIVDNLATQRVSSLFNLPIATSYSFHQGDLGVALTKSLVESVDAVIHLAGITEPVASVSDPEWLYENNYRITKHVANLCYSSGTPLVFVSSTSVYTSGEEIVDESCLETYPVSPYAQCKLEEEDYIQSILDPRKFAIFRLGTIFGVSPGMRFHTAVNKFCWQAAMRQTIEVWTTALDQRRPYLAVSDAIGVLSKTVIDGMFTGEVINAVTCNVTVREVLAAIENAAGTPNVRFTDSPLMNSLSFETSVRKAEHLGYRFQGDLNTEVAMTMDLLRGISG
jgi:UDP-glucose 4-epimerase